MNKLAGRSIDSWVPQGTERYESPKHFHKTVHCTCFRKQTVNKIQKYIDVYIHVSVYFLDIYIYLNIYTHLSLCIYIL